MTINYLSFRAIAGIQEVFFVILDLIQNPRYIPFLLVLKKKKKVWIPNQVGDDDIGGAAGGVRVEIADDSESWTTIKDFEDDSGCAFEDEKSLVIPAKAGIQEAFLCLHLMAFLPQHNHENNIFKPFLVLLYNLV